MKIVILGAGPAGLYAGLLIKKAHPRHEITILERNPADVTYGWGVVFSDRTLASFQMADYKTYEQITNHFVIWDSIDVHYRGETIRCGGHVIASISRQLLLNILQRRCDELGITLKFQSEVTDLAQISDCDLLIAADGINSIVRRTYAPHFKPSIELGKARYIWLGANKVLDCFTFIFRENEHGLFQVHAYPFNGTTSTFIVECDSALTRPANDASLGLLPVQATTLPRLASLSLNERSRLELRAQAGREEEATWLKAGLDKADEMESVAYCEKLLAPDLAGAALLSNNSKWNNFPTLQTKTWHHQRIVLLGDAAHTAHFSIGSGTKLAMEDAIALASALEQHEDIETALNAFELERKPVVEIFQKAAKESQAYFETIKRYLGLDPMQFTFQLLTRSGRISYDDLRLRDPYFGDAVDRWCAQKANQQVRGMPLEPLVAPPPMFALLRLRELTLPNRIALSPLSNCPAQNGLPNERYAAQFSRLALRGTGFILSGPVAISSDARISPGCAGMYDPAHQNTWTRIVEFVHSHSPAKIGIRLNHAGRRGSTRPRAEGLDRPLREGNWPLISASTIAYTPNNQVPREMDRADMDRVCNDFVRAAQMAQEADFDLVQLHMAHGYLLASFLSPLSNRRTDEYGGDLEHRMRFPLEVFDAVRATWPENKPIAVAISATDCVNGGFEVEDAVTFARLLKVHGCDIIEVLAGQTTIEGEPAYGRGFLTPLSDQVRNEAGILTMVGGYLTTSNEVNTILAAGRADLCIMELPHLDNSNDFIEVSPADALPYAEPTVTQQRG